MPIIEETGHRPWPLPNRPWVMAMNWHDLLFLHWPIPPEELRPLIPSALELDTFEGSAWIGVVPFHMTGVRPRGFPSFAGMAFPEMNVRTYVKSPGRTGVWFFSLDAASRIAVRVARFWYHLPYYDAHISVESRENRVEYQSVRIHRNAPPAQFQASYYPLGPVYRSAPGALDHWLTERYCLYAVTPRGRTGYLDIHHLPWPLQPAEVELRVNSMIRPLAVTVPKVRPVAHFARHLSVVAWTFAPL